MNTDSRSPSVAVVILNWNGLDDTRECLNSLQKIDYPTYKVIIVDNGSRGNDVEVLKETFGSYIDVIANQQNTGYARGVNTGIKYALEKYAPDYYLLLNNDTIVATDFLSRLVSALEERPGAGIAGPKVYYYDRPDVIQSLGANVNMYTGQASYPGLQQKDWGQYDRMQKVDWVGPCALIKAGVIRENGYFDEGYFAYWEDVDFCARAGRDGFSTIYVPESRIWHKLGGASGGTSERMYYFMARNRIRFMRKNATRAQFACFMFYMIFYNIWATAGYLMVKGRWPLLRGFWRGTWDGIGSGTANATFYM